ncbi:hypothetical protein WR25_21908 isoform E [Diploscapter pachys]|nr:hypothetical protein WR25_21908 isoform E [Diploscapter pachys]
MSTDFVPETEDDEQPETAQEKKEGEDAATDAETGTSKEAGEKKEEAEFQRRYLNEKWYGRYGNNGAFLEYNESDEWKEVDEDMREFVEQLWYEQQNAEQQTKNYTWDEEKKEWIRKENAALDDDTIAEYQAHYGEQFIKEYDQIYEKMDAELKEKTEAKIKEVEEKREKKKMKKAGQPQQQGWIDMEEKSTAVYVSGMPTDVTIEEFTEFMSKCGVIQQDPRTRRSKIKLYLDDEGNSKGDGRCCYIKMESVELALSILDGARMRDCEVKVEKAHFELKGEFDPAKKKRKLTPAQKKRFFESQNKIFEWKPDKPRNYRPLSDCTVIIKNLFTLEQMAKNAALLLDLKEEVEQSCAKYGAVKKVVVYDNNPEGVVSVAFESTEHSDLAVKMLNGRIVDGRE